ncbi:MULTISPECIES: type IV secretory system conjugative DNA transfer family protein [unclassified Ruegeria]|uniref:type IV secretory system conjugative DNA transfer family protein n=1 Tax=unclassified Ruegeria TaxID=2625375 RepID=UPI001491F889|nr:MULTISPECIES: type IV secretory system conjugative DNA transfer family protein [unclassified Ruegeria]NOD35613.1 type IV secretory system conjugative DNA transfer family protein [Ruegeria sp. HKCCD7296]NOE42979.1 type IV secretory system conjugative DNA transfer family protein [Ruegeria sp. HKCCD7319]
MEEDSNRTSQFSIKLGHTVNEATKTGFLKNEASFAKSREIRTDPEGHLISFAPTGSGKTWTLAIPTLLEYQGSVVAFDPKGELAQSTAGARQAMGQHIIVLDPFGISGFESSSLNPFDLRLRGNSDTLEAAQSLAGSIANETSKVDPFWDSSARNLLAQLILFVYHECPKALCNLHEIAYLLNQSLKDFTLTLKDMARSRNPIVSSGSHAFPMEAERTIASILSSARRFTEVFRGKRIDAVTRYTSFPLQVFDGEKPFTLYMILPPIYLSSHSSLIRVWMESIISKILERSTKNHSHTLFMIDEAAQLGPMQFMLTVVTLLRSYGVQCWTFWQDPQQLQACYPQNWRTLFNNSRYHTVFGRQSFLAEEGFASLYGRMDKVMLQDGFFAELGEEPRYFLRPKVQDVVERVMLQPEFHRSNGELGTPRRMNQHKIYQSDRNDQIGSGSSDSKHDIPF